MSGKGIVSILLLVTVISAIICLSNADSTSAEPVDPYVGGGASYALDETDGVRTAVASWDGSSTEVTIESSVTVDGQTFLVTSVESFKNNTTITRVTIHTNNEFVLPNEIFRGATHLTQIVISGPIESLPDQFCSGATTLSMVDLSGCTNLISIGSNAFSGTSITGISLPATLTEIGVSCFSNCKSLENITLPSQIHVIPGSAFSGCERLENITMGEITKFGAGAFKGCKVLKSVDVSSATDIGDEAFSTCYEFKSVTLNEDLLDIGSKAFYGCQKLTSVNLPGKTVTMEGNLFEACKALTDVTLSSDLKKIPSACFKGCTSLETIDLRNVETVAMNAFNGCKLLDNLQLTNIKYINDSAFAGCTELKNLSFGDKLERIDQKAFNGCAFSELILPATAVNITWCGGATRSFPDSLRTISISSENSKYVVRDGIVYAKDMSQALYCPTLATGERTVYADVADYSFKGCHLSRIIIADGVETIGSGAFTGCPELEELVIADSVTTIGGGAIGGTTANNVLKKLVLPAGLTSVGAMLFNNLKALQYVVFPEQAFTPTIATTFNGVKFYLSDGNGGWTQAPALKAKTSYTAVMGKRFVWNGTDVGNFYELTDDKVLLETVVEGEVTYQAVDRNTTLSIVPALPDHKVFDGWYSDESFTVACGVTYTLTADARLFAKISPETHTVTYMVGGDVIGEIETWEYGAEVSVRPAYDKVGYTVGGWVSENVTPTEGNFVIGDVDIVFTATCVVNQYTITFDTAGGSAIAAITQDYNTSVTVPSTEPSKEGYRFVRWDPEIPALMPANDVILKAVWAIVATVNENGKSVVALDSETSSFIPAADTKEITVEIRENTAVKVENASDLVGKTVVSKVEPVSNSTGVSGTAYEFTFTADGTQYNGKIQVTLPYTKEDGKEPVVYYWNGSESTKMNVVSSTETSVTFETDHNSTYVVASETPSKDDGASFLLYFGILMIAGICVSMLVGFNFYRKKA